MIRTDIINKMGREYLTSNIENGEFSYKKALSDIGKNIEVLIENEENRIF